MKKTLKEKRDLVFKVPDCPFERARGRLFCHPESANVYTAYTLMQMIHEKYGSSKDETSYFKGIPIEFLEAFKVIYAEHQSRGLTVCIQKLKIRYRGPRAHRKDDPNRQSYCLKKDATTFAVYPA